MVSKHLRGLNFGIFVDLAHIQRRLAIHLPLPPFGWRSENHMDAGPLPLLAVFQDIVQY